MGTQELEEDLAYVRATLDQARPLTPKSIPLFWGLAMLIGLPLGDFRSEWMSTYWMVVGPGGWVISGILAVLHGKKRGQLDRRSGYRQAAHWGAMVVIMLLLSALPAQGFIPWEAMGPIILLMLALTYATAAVHFGLLQLIPAILFAIAYGTMLLSPPYPWTIVGVLTASGLFSIALMTEKSLPRSQEAVEA